MVQYAARLATHATPATHFAYDGSYARARVWRLTEKSVVIVAFGATH